MSVDLGIVIIVLNFILGITNMNTNKQYSGINILCGALGIVIIANKHGMLEFLSK